MKLTNEACPEWVKSRIELVYKDLQRGNLYYFVHTISKDDKENKNNKFDAFIVTDSEVVEFNATFESIIVHKYLRENIDRVIKRIDTSIDDNPKSEDVICGAMDLVFKDGTAISITEPTYKGENNLSNYKLFISMF